MRACGWRREACEWYKEVRGGGSVKRRSWRPPGAPLNACGRCTCDDKGENDRLGLVLEVDSVVRDRAEGDERDGVVEHRLAHDQVVERAVHLQRREEREGGDGVNGRDERGELARLGEAQVDEHVGIVDVEQVPRDRRGHQRADHRQPKDLVDVLPKEAHVELIPGIEDDWRQQEEGEEGGVKVQVRLAPLYVRREVRAHEPAGEEANQDGRAAFRQPEDVLGVQPLADAERDDVEQNHDRNGDGHQMLSLHTVAIVQLGRIGRIHGATPGAGAAAAPARRRPALIFPDYFGE